MIWAAVTDQFFRYWVYATAPIMSLILLGIWWSLFSPGSAGRRLLRLVGVVLAVALVGIVFGVLFRPAGSSGGSSLPRFVWRWAADPGSDVASLTPVTPPQTASDPSTSEDVAETLATPEGALDSLQFLGPERDGVIPNIQLDPDWESNPPEILWKQPIGLGWSSFSVRGGRAVTTEQRETDELTTCYELATGQLLWQHVHESTRFSESMGGDGPRSTPTIEVQPDGNDRVYVLGGTGILDCLELETGKPIWTRNVLEDAGAPNLEWATTAAPLLIPNDLIVVSGGNKTGPELIAYSRDTGDEVWRSGDHGGSYSSPRLVDIDGVSTILHVHGIGVAGHSPVDGKKFWDVPWGNKMPRVAQPQVLPNRRVLMTGSYNHNSHLFQLGAPVDEGAVCEVETLWESRRMKTKFSSAVIHGEHAYGLDEGMFACIDLKDGDRVWKDGRYGFGQQLLVEKLILLFSERGALILIEPTPEEHRELATFQVFEKSKCWAAPSLAGRYCLIRSETEAACVRLPIIAE